MKGAYQSRLKRALSLALLGAVAVGWSAWSSPALAQAPAKKAMGPLRVHPTNPRYFTDGTKSADGTLRAVYLTGSHTWNNQQEIEGFRAGKSPDPLAGKFDFQRYLNFLESYHHNFYRHWIFEFAKDGETTVAPHPWPRTGPGVARDGKPKFDLSKFDESYFTRLRSRLTAARDHGIYAAVMLFESSFGESAWPGHPFHPDNNVNGVDGGGMVRFHSLQSAAIVRLQEAYVRKVVDTVNDLDNVLYDVCNEPGQESYEWCVHFCKFIRAYQAAKPRQHPVGLASLFDKSQWHKYQSWIARNDQLFSSPFDWISPGGWAKDPQASVWAKDPPAGDGRKVVFADTDHGIWPQSPRPGWGRAWVWKCFVRGHQPVLMDWYDSQPMMVSREEQEAMRKAMGYTRRYAEKINLAAMTPRGDVVSTQYCLANPGQEYLVYLPDGGEVTVDLSAVKGTLAVEWFNPRSGDASGGGLIEGGAKRSLRAAFEGDAALYLKADGEGQEDFRRMSGDITIPTVADLATRLRKGHPRLLASAKELAELKQRFNIHAQFKQWHQQLREQAEKILAQSPPRAETPDGWRGIDSRVYTLALLYWLDGDRRCVERAWLEMQAVANRPDWNPHHFLDTAHMTQGLAIGYDWLYHQWTPAQRETLRTAILEKGIRFANDVHNKDFTRWSGVARRGRTSRYWPEVTFNWNQVCNGGIGLGALALLDEAPQPCGEFLQAAIRSIQRPMGEFAPDGALEEGPGYWNYAVSHNVLFLSALESALGTDFGLSQAPGFAETGLFPLYFTGPLGRTFNFADGLDTRYPTPHMFWLARKFNRPVYATYARQAALPKALDLLWFDPHGESLAASNLPLDKHFRGKEIAFFRGAWDDPDAVFIGFKAGNNQAPHGHLDLGTFVLDALGVRWAVDLDGEDYNLPGYWDRKKQRWTYYRLRAEGHNTLVINQSAEADQNPEALTSIVRFQSEPARAFAIADLSPAYTPQARQVQRGIALLDRKSVLVQDEVDTEQASDVWWFLHTPAEGEVSGEGTTATLTQGNARLWARILSPPGARFSWMDARPLPASPNPQGQKSNDSVRKLAVHLSGVTNARLAVLLAPLCAGEAVPERLPEIVPLVSW